MTISYTIVLTPTARQLAAWRRALDHAQFRSSFTAPLAEHNTIVQAFDDLRAALRQAGERERIA